MRLFAVLALASAVAQVSCYPAARRTLGDHPRFRRQARSVGQDVRLRLRPPLPQQYETLAAKPTWAPTSVAPSYPRVWQRSMHSVGDPDDDDAPSGGSGALAQRLLYPQLAVAALATVALLVASPLSSHGNDAMTQNPVVAQDSSSSSISRRGGSPPDVGAILRDRIAFLTSEVTGEKLGQVRIGPRRRTVEMIAQP